MNIEEYRKDLCEHYWISYDKYRARYPYHCVLPESRDSGPMMWLHQNLDSEMFDYWSLRKHDNILVIWFTNASDAMRFKLIYG